MKKIIALILTVIMACAVLAGCSSKTDKNDEDVLYNGIVYKRCDDESFDLKLYEDNARYIGDFMESYDNGYQIPWSVYVLNGDENVLYSSKAIWLKPGYSLPENFGEEFSSVEYVVSEGIDFLIMEDDYKETATLLKTFETGVKLEDVVETDPSEISGYTEYDRVRFRYKNHANIASLYTICALDGEYYLNVRKADGANEWHKIKPEYVELLTSVISKGQNNG